MNVVWFYTVGGVLFLLLAIATYAYAVSTRKRVLCPSCAEPVQMEHDRVRHCPSCGASLS